MKKLLVGGGLAALALLASILCAGAALAKLPAISDLHSPSHTIATRWYDNRHVDFVWTPITAASGYSYALDRTPGSVPDTHSDPTVITCFRSEKDDPTGLAAGFGPVGVRDFNNDGRLDILVWRETGSGVSSVAVLLGDGKGGFAKAAKTYPVGNTGAWPTAIGDFNNDGKLDLATIDAYGTIDVYLGNGKGGFASGKSYASGEERPSGVVEGDFNKDGNLDLAVSSSKADTVGILLGDGKGGFASKTDYATGGGTGPLAVADFNGDGNPDLAVVNGFSTLRIFLGDGTGSFAPQTDVTVGDSPDALAVADFNKDGKPDLAVSELEDWGVSILLGDGTGGFAAKTDYFAGFAPQSVVAADFDGDGNLDLVVGNEHSDGPDYTGTLSFFLGNGDGAFRAKTDFVTRSQATAAIPADLNGDGKVDLVTEGPKNTVAVLLSRPLASKAYGGRADGVWYFHVRALDGASNGGPTATLAVRIDTHPPSTKARPVSVYRGHICLLRCAVIDPEPCAGWAAVRVWVRNSRGTVVARLTYAHLHTGVWFYPKFRCWLPEGTYRFYVYAADAAGNTQSKVGWSTLAVK